MGERIAANQLAALLLLFVLGLILVERWSRSRTKYYQASSRYRQLQTYQLKGIREILAVMACFLPLFFGFLLPAGLLVKLTLANWQLTLDERFWIFARNSLILATLTAILAVVIALIMAYGLRLYPNLGVQLGTRVAAMGYAVPGSVIAVGIMVPIGKFDNLLDSWMRENLGISTGLLLSGTIAALVFAYIVRFLAVSLNAVESSLSKIKPNLDDAARSLGYSPMQTLVTVHTPMMTGGLLTAMMLVFVDVMKELPATIIIRPFNFDTLAVRTYQLASDERLAEASGPALAIVLVGMLPVILLSWKIARSRKSSTELTVNS
jgi:iron(III) transport system permease protein